MTPTPGEIEGFQCRLVSLPMLIALKLAASGFYGGARSVLPASESEVIDVSASAARVS